MALEVQAPDGSLWTIKRVWIPFRPRWRAKKPEGSLDALDGADVVSSLDDPLGCGIAIAIAIAVVVIGFIGWVFVLPVLIFLGEVVLLLLAVVLGIVARVLFRRPWTIEVRKRSARAEPVRVPAVGWRGSRERIEELANEIRHGRGPAAPVTEPKL